MTPAEATVLVERLELVWEVDWPLWGVQYDALWFKAQLLPDIDVEFWFMKNASVLRFNRTRTGGANNCSWSTGRGWRIGDQRFTEEATRWATPLIPVFSRGIWLSGLPLEATAHEKAEWMQGFSAEELKSWNLVHDVGGESPSTNSQLISGEFWHTKWLDEAQ